MERLHRSMTGRGLVVLAVAQDDGGKAPVKQFVRRMKITFPVALDPKQTAGGSFGVRDLPSTFLISPDGAVIAAVKGGVDWESPAVVEYLERQLESHGAFSHATAAKP